MKTCMCTGCPHAAQWEHATLAPESHACSLGCLALLHATNEAQRLFALGNTEARASTVIVPIKIARVVDGDTVVDANNVHYRLVHIDSPEKAQPGGMEATAYLQAMIDGAQRQVDGTDFPRARIGARLSGKDRYGRVLAELVLLEVPGASVPPSVNEAMVRAGWAWAYDRTMAREQAWRTLEREAQNEKRGLWALPGTPVLPHDWRRLPRAERSRIRRDYAQLLRR